MQLMDDALFKHWREERVTIEDVLAKAQNPDELAKRIVNAQRGIMEEHGALPPGSDDPGAPRKPGGH